MRQYLPGGLARPGRAARSRRGGGALSKRGYEMDKNSLMITCPEGQNSVASLVRRTVGGMSPLCASTTPGTVRRNGLPANQIPLYHHQYQGSKGGRGRGGRGRFAFSPNRSVIKPFLIETSERGNLTPTQRRSTSEISAPPPSILTTRLAYGGVPAPPACGGWAGKCTTNRGALE